MRKYIYKALTPIFLFCFTITHLNILAMSRISRVHLNDDIILDFDPVRNSVQDVLETIEEKDLTTVKKIDFSGNSIQDIQAKQILYSLGKKAEESQNLANLEYLSFRGNEMTNFLFSDENPQNSIDDLLTIIAKPSLKYIDLSSNYISGDTLKPIFDDKRLYKVLAGIAVGAVLGYGIHQVTTPPEDRERQKIRGVIMAILGGACGGLTADQLGAKKVGETRELVRDLFTRVIWLPKLEWAQDESEKVRESHRKYYEEYYHEN